MRCTRANVCFSTRSESNCPTNDDVAAAVAPYPGMTPVDAALLVLTSGNQLAVVFFLSLLRLISSSSGRSRRSVRPSSKEFSAPVSNERGVCDGVVGALRALPHAREGMLPTPCLCPHVGCQ